MFYELKVLVIDNMEWFNVGGLMKHLHFLSIKERRYKDIISEIGVSVSNFATFAG